MKGCIIYDLDGVLVNACEWHYEALNAALRKVSGDEILRDEHLSTFNGLPTKLKLDMLVEQRRLKAKDIPVVWALKQDMTLEIIASFATIDYQKIEMHNHLKETVGWPVGCVTNSIRKTANLMLEMTGQLDYIDHLITNEDIINPKPSPDGYHKMMRNFNVSPSLSLVVEDSPKGIEAGKRSGANVFVVKDSSEVTFDAIFGQIKLIKGGGEWTEN